MLEAICERLRADFPGVCLVVPSSMSPEVRLQFGLWVSVPRDFWRADVSGLANFIPKRLRRFASLAAPEDIDVVLDASGFGYGEYWGLRKLQRRILAPLRHWKTGNKSVVLLPQALGPFETPDMKAAFGEVLQRADIVFARDKQSYGFAEGVTDNPRSLRLAPDFTNLLHPALPERLRSLAGKSIIIPNQRVIKSEADREEYVSFLVLSARKLLASGRTSFILVHEGVADRKLADEVNARLGAEAIAVVDEGSTLATKAIIASADLIVSSRFHGLVSALSSGVPALACGWSHKYEELMEDYGCRQHMVSMGDRASWDIKLDDFLKDASNSVYREKLSAMASRERGRSEVMWGEVITLLKSRHGAVSK